MTIQKKLVIFCPMTVFALLLASCAIYKPLRVVGSKIFGLTCVTNDICLKAPATIDEANQLRTDALSFIAENVKLIEHAPRVLFCHSEDCFARFGNPAVAALYIWGLNNLIINDIKDYAGTA